MSHASCDNDSIDHFLEWGVPPSLSDKLVIAISSRPLFDVDDQRGHCESACQQVATGHVPYGVAKGPLLNLVGKAA